MVGVFVERSSEILREEKKNNNKYTTIKKITHQWRRAGKQTKENKKKIKIKIKITTRQKSKQKNQNKNKQRQNKKNYQGRQDPKPIKYAAKTRTNAQHYSNGGATIVRGLLVRGQGGSYGIQRHKRATQAIRTLIYAK